MDSSVVHTVTIVAKIINFLIFIGIIFVQIFLSRKEKKVIGYILPFAAFMRSVIYIINYAVNVFYNTGIDIKSVKSLIITFLITNIPTIILLIIYFICRKQLKQKQQLNKMNIQDLN